MAETVQEYRKRIIDHVGTQNPVKLQAAAHKKLARLVKAVPASKLRKRPAPGKWSIAEIAAHLADVEIVVGYRMRVILGAPGTSIQAFDQDSWVTSGHYEKRDTRKAIEQYRVLREANLALLKSLAPEQWKHYGMHSERGEESIELIVRMIAGHDLNHIQQIERILASKKA
jgi:DinB superfamily